MPPEQQQQQNHPLYVTTLGTNDVLLGRGSGPNDHEGNVKFRQFVAERKQAYMATNHRLTKTKIAREIVDLVASSGGRFLKKIEDEQQQQRVMMMLGHQHHTVGGDLFEVVSDDTVMEKAKQALRQNAGKQQQQQQQNPPPPKDGKRMPQPLPPNVDLEPIPFTDEGYSGPLPSRTDINTVWEQQQQVITAYQLQQQQQQQRQQLLPVYEQQQQQDWQTQPFPFQQQQQQMPPPMRVPSLDLPHQPQGFSQHPQPQQLSSMDMAQLQQFQQLRSSESSDAASNNNNTFADPVRGRSSKRASLTIADLQRHRSAASHSNNDVDELRDSFSKLSAGEAQQQNQHSKLMASSDTMGTIDYQQNDASMLLMNDMSINSSALSIFNKSTNDSCVMLDASMSALPSQQQQQHNRNSQFLWQSQQHKTVGGETTAAAGSPQQQQQQQYLHTAPGGRDSSSSSNKTKDSGDSMSFSDLFDKNGKSSSLSCSMNGLMHDIRKQVESEMGTAPTTTTTTATTLHEETPLVLDVDNMRQSSLDVVKSLLPTESEQQQLAQEGRSASQQQQAYYRQDPQSEQTTKTRNQE